MASFRFLGSAAVLVIATVVPAAVQAQSYSSATGSLPTAPSGFARPPIAPLPSLQLEVPRGETVGERPHPDYEPLGIRAGTFIVYPDLELQQYYNTNILGTANDPKSDFITAINPALDIKSDWPNHALNFHADGTFNEYANYPIEDYTDYTFSTNGRVDIQHDARILGGIGYSVRHEPVYSPNNLGSTIPNPYSDLAANLIGEKEFGPLKFHLEDDYDRFQFSDVASAAGAPIAMHLENYQQEQITLRTGYEPVPLRQIYLLTSYNIRIHDFSTDLSGFNRNSTGGTVALGANYDLTGVLFIDAYAGYIVQDYQDPRLANIGAPTFSAKLTWNVTRLTTVTGSAVRGITESDQPFVSGYLVSQEQLRVDHELLRNLDLNGSVSLEQDNYDGISRADNYYSAAVGAKYWMNRHFSFTAGYTYQVRQSTEPGGGFVANIVYVGISSHF
jgi:hypothetical protein